jgi:hypothetical protein
VAGSSRESRLEVQGAHRVGAGAEMIVRQGGFAVFQEPGTFIHRIGVNREVEPGHPQLRVEHREEGCRQRERGGRRADGTLHEGRHHRRRHGERVLEDAPFVLQRFSRIVVVGVDRRLLPAADDPHGSPQQHERPERLRLVAGERPLAVERPDGRQGRGRRRSLVVQDRRHRHG